MLVAAHFFLSEAFNEIEKQQFFLVIKKFQCRSAVLKQVMHIYGVKSVQL